MQPAWLVDGLAAVMLVTAAYCSGRLVAATAWHSMTHFDVDVGHVAMGVAMAGMLVSSLRTLPSGAWEVIFGFLSAWFAVQLVRFVWRFGLRGWDDDHLHHVSHYVTHLAMGLAMIYMFTDPSMSRMALAPAGDMAAMGSAPSSAAASGVPLLFVFVLLVAAVWYGDGLTRFVRRSAVTAGALVNVVEDTAAAAIDGGPADQQAVTGDRAGNLQTEIVVRRRVALGDVLSCRDNRWLAPRLEIATHIAMCVTMSYMLVLLR